QVPPMYSALKKDGKRLYELARQGRVVEREPRDIEIHAIELLESSGARLVFRVTCSKGTYVRALVEDIAKAAGTVAHTAHLHRERVGHFRAEDMLDMEAAERAAEAGAAELNRQLLPADQALADWPAARIPAEAAERFVGGQRVPLDEDQRPAPAARLRVYDGDNRFLGVGELTGDGWLAPRRVFRRLQDGATGRQRGTRAGQAAAAAPQEPEAGTADRPEFCVSHTITGPVETIE
ncbi:MAG: tRNA pseudouridine(55) synthase TruB, partial [Woeseiaceae bacterium]